MPMRIFRDDGPPAPHAMYQHSDRRWWCVDKCAVVADTEKAVLVHSDGTDEPYWLPKSQLHEDDNECWEEGDEGTLVFSAWIGRQKGWL